MNSAISSRKQGFIVVILVTFFVLVTTLQSKANLPTGSYTCAAYLLTLNEPPEGANPSPLYSMREFRQKMGRGDSDADWRPVQFAGTLESLKSERAQGVRQRLNGLEEDLQSTDGTLTYGTEVRGGAAVEKYVSTLSQLNQNITQTSMEYLRQNGAGIFRKSQVIPLTLTLISVMAQMTAGPHSNLEPLLKLITAFGLTLVADGVGADYSRVDQVEMRSNAFLQAVNKEASKKTPQKFLFFSGNFQLNEVMLANLKGEADEKLFLEQVLAKHVLDSSLPDVSAQTLYFLKNPSSFNSPRPSEVNILIDQMFYVDSATQEPVLVTYVRENKKHIPRPTRQQKRAEKQDLNFNWWGTPSGAETY